MAKQIKISKNVSKLKIVKKQSPKFSFLKQKKQVLCGQILPYGEAGRNRISYERNIGKFTSLGVAESLESNDGWNCKVTHSTGEFSSDSVIETNNAISKIFLGGVYDMDNLVRGNVTTVPYARKPFSILVDSTNFAVASGDVTDPTKKGVRETLNRILRSKDRPDTSISYGAMGQVDSEMSILTQFSGSGHYLGFGGSHQINFNSTRKSHKYYVESFMEYYSVSVNNDMNEPKDFFYIKEDHPNVDDAIVKNAIDPNWVFVDSVRYGKMLYLLIESDESFESMGMNLKQYADYWVAGVELEEKYKNDERVKRVSITVFTIGGTALASGALIGSDDKNIRKAIKDYFQQINDEVPIGYSLTTLDQQTVGTRIYADYVSRRCSPAAHTYKVTWQAVTCDVNDDGGYSDGEEVRAMVRIRAWDGNGKDIMDAGRINKDIIEKSKAGIPGQFIPFTFSKGSRENPIQLKENESFYINKSIVFPVKPDDKKAKIGFRADIVEYDDLDPDDNFADATLTVDIKDVNPHSSFSLVCQDEESRIEFQFKIEPVYD